MMSGPNLLTLAGLGVLFAVATTSQPVADAAPAAPYATDSRGYVDSTARCDAGQTAVAVGRTQRSLVVICTTGHGGYRYRSERISDGAALTATASATGDGFEAETDSAVYAVSPTELTVTSGGKVIYRDTWIEYRQAATAAG
jgi:hypothetical protein